MKHSILLGVLTAIVCLAGCGNKGGQENSYGSEDQVQYILRDTAIYGFCAEGSAMNTLQIITDGGDTISVSTTGAREKDRILGGYAVGDEVTLLANADTTTALCVINRSVLYGDWVMPNPMDGSNETGFRILRGGSAESIDQGTLIYKSWRLFNGQLQFSVSREDGIDMDEIQVYDILKLTPDQLIIRTTDEDPETQEYSRPMGDEYTEEDLQGIILDEGDADEFDL
jgi:hypothetical protein